MWQLVNIVDYEVEQRELFIDKADDLINTVSDDDYVVTLTATSENDAASSLKLQMCADGDSDDSSHDEHSTQSITQFIRRSRRYSEIHLAIIGFSLYDGTR